MILKEFGDGVCEFVKTDGTKVIEGSLS